MRSRRRASRAYPRKMGPDHGPNTKRAPRDSALAFSPGHTTAPNIAAASDATPALGAGHPRPASPAAATANGSAEINIPRKSTMIE
jgi:hypothetical protein